MAEQSAYVRCNDARRGDRAIMKANKIKGLFSRRGWHVPCAGCSLQGSMARAIGFFPVGISLR
jgi:hypothetical protein